MYVIDNDRKTHDSSASDDVQLKATCIFILRPQCTSRSLLTSKKFFSLQLQEAKSEPERKKTC